MDKAEFLTIYGTFENLSTVRKTLPGIIEETRQNDARLIVHDSSVEGREEKWEYLKKLNESNDFFLLLSSNLSMAHARNMCLQLGQELFAPEYICMVEDDHSFLQGLIPSMIEAMQKFYGKQAPNGLRFGLFTGCGVHHTKNRHLLDEGHAYPDAMEKPFILGRANSCFRCAPTAHWNNVLKGYDTDEYLISTYQTSNLVWRNYHRGFTVMIVGNGEYCTCFESIGRGVTGSSGKKLWDDVYTASDNRSIYRKE